MYLYVNDAVSTYYAIYPYEIFTPLRYSQELENETEMCRSERTDYRTKALEV